jgi:hypothetical protein
LAENQNFGMLEGPEESDGVLEAWAFFVFEDIHGGPTKSLNVVVN